MPAVKTSHNIAIMPERSRMSNLSDWKQSVFGLPAAHFPTSNIKRVFFFFPLHQFRLRPILEKNNSLSQRLKSSPVSSLFTHLCFLPLIALSLSIPPSICFNLSLLLLPHLSIYSSLSPALSLYFYLFLPFPLVAS